MDMRTFVQLNIRFGSVLMNFSGIGECLVLAECLKELTETEHLDLCLKTEIFDIIIS